MKNQQIRGFTVFKINQSKLLKKNNTRLIKIEKELMMETVSKFIYNKYNELFTTLVYHTNIYITLKMLLKFNGVEHGHFKSSY